jgi:hypothetical protein
MPRPYLGVKQVLILIHPDKHRKMKRLAELRKKGVCETYRDVVDDALERMKSCLR